MIFKVYNNNFLSKIPFWVKKNFLFHLSSTGPDLIAILRYIDSADIVRCIINIITAAAGANRWSVFSIVDLIIWCVVWHNCYLDFQCVFVVVRDAVYLLYRVLLEGSESGLVRFVVKNWYTMCTISIWKSILVTNYWFS